MTAGIDWPMRMREWLRRNPGAMWTKPGNGSPEHSVTVDGEILASEVYLRDLVTRVEDLERTSRM